MIRRMLIVGVAGIIGLVGLASSASAQQTLKPEQKPELTLKRVGLKVIRVLPGSPAAMVGFEAGDIIVTVNGQSVRSLADLHLALSRGGRMAELEVLDAWTGMPTLVLVRQIEGRIGVFVTPVPLNGYRPFDPFIGMGSQQKP